MAQYWISHTCGHSRTIQIYGKGTEPQRKIEWFEWCETQECPQCCAAKEREIEAAKRSEDKRKAAEAQVIVETKIAGIPKPSRPSCHPREAHPGCHWNGKYYGNDNYGYRYYADGVSYPLSDDDYKACMDYRKAMDVYNTQIEQAKKAVA